MESASVSLSLFVVSENPTSLERGTQRLSLIGEAWFVRACTIARAIEGAATDLAPVQITWQITVRALAGVLPFFVGDIEFSKRIIQQNNCEVCGGSGLVLKNKIFVKCQGCVISENIFEEPLETNQNKSEETAGETVEAPHGSNGFAEVMNNVKVIALEIINNISNFIQDMFGAKTEANSSEAGSNPGFQSFITPNTFYALAIAVILIVLVKRA